MTTFSVVKCPILLTVKWWKFYRYITMNSLAQFQTWICLLTWHKSIYKTIGIPILLQLLNILTTTSSLIGTIPLVPQGVRVLNLAFNKLGSTISSSIFQCQYITQIILNNNILTGTTITNTSTTTSSLIILMHTTSGTIPNIIDAGNSAIQILSLSSNYLTGSIDSSFSNLDSLNTLILSNNRLTGNLVPVHASSIDLSSNFLSGQIPSQFFTANLVSLTLINNCITGNLPGSICSSSNLILLAMDSLGGSCETKYLKRRLRMTGPIPACVFKFNNLSTLTISGNSFTGTISDISPASQLKVLNLAGNILQGPIPSSVQQYGGFESIDLSNNQLFGTNNNFNNIKSNTNTTTAGNISYFSFDENTISLSFEVNRLSGDLPNSFNSIPNLNILEGNLFSCSSFRKGKSKNNNLNSQILNKSGYQCGSFMFNASLSVYGSFLLVIITIYIFSTDAKESYRKLGTLLLLPL